ncbi:MFS transporter, sugar porter (SP) family [Terribacillus aidingensis]|uniref:MFS transporter, sugar porter (SP) family n=1 Tax=Terribacillus aidingensis TaxID=586416 RepID=A0A285P7J6_9BACI|nr:sugar porter family MFS transporter [Terribacillus aidingensis]SNZ17418.1 MFS transporter, sugar porter (SP) family [Terribacillus aidingensis]
MSKVSSKFIFFFGSFAGILFGYDIGIIAGAEGPIHDEFNLSPLWLGIVVSSLMGGAIIGSILSGLLGDRFGRRNIILFSSVIFLVGSIGSAVAPEEITLTISRIILGVAVGTASSLVPAYMSEIAPAKVRGKLSGLNQLMIVSGMLLSYIVSFIFEPVPNSWRWMLGSAGVFAIVLYFGVLKLPESPRYLIKNGMADKAREVLSSLRGSKAEVDAEIAEINSITKYEKKGVRQLFQKRFRMALIIGIGIATFQQVQGANSIVYYATSIARNVGLAPQVAAGFTVIVGVIFVVTTIIFLQFVDKFNRRAILTVGGTGMALSFFAPAILEVIGLNESALNWITLISLCSFILFYSFSWAPLTWIIVGEIFPLSVRGIGAGISSAFNWTGSLVVGLVFPILADQFSFGVIFSSFGVICVLGLLFVRFVVVETKGRSLEQIEAELTARSEKSAG